MNVQLLKSFLVVAKCKNFTQAAQTLNYTQPAISNHIMNLEKLYGVQFFQRDGKNLYLTEAGCAFCVYARQIVEDYENSLEKMAAFCKTQRVLKIAVSTQFINYFLMDVLSDLRAKYPDLRIEVHRCMTIDKTLHETFVEKIYDLAFIHMDAQPLYTKRRVLWSQKIIWAVNSKMYKAHKQSNNLYEYPYIAYPKSSMYFNALKDKIAFQRFNTQFTYSDSETVIQAILKNLGIGLVPEIKIKRELEEKNIVALPSKYGIELPISIIYPQSLEITPEIKCFFDLLSEYVKRI